MNKRCSLPNEDRRVATVLLLNMQASRPCNSRPTPHEQIVQKLLCHGVDGSLVIQTNFNEGVCCSISQGAYKLVPERERFSVIQRAVQSLTYICTPYNTMAFSCFDGVLNTRYTLFSLGIYFFACLRPTTFWTDST